jgi:FkbM family methyltransferase
MIKVSGFKHILIKGCVLFASTSFYLHFRFTSLGGDNVNGGLRAEKTSKKSFQVQNWTSEYQLNCKLLANKNNQQDEIFKETSTNPSFMMNIHNPSKDSVSRTIWETGCWECDHIKALINALDHYSGSYFLDVGGNIGMWTLSAAAANHPSITIEAMPENAHKICGSVNKNSFHDLTHVVNIAATDKPTKFKFNVAKGNMGGTRVVELVGDVIDNTDENVVRGVPIDSLNLPTDKPVVLKLDVEGHEFMALSGAMQFLKEANIVYAMTELRNNLEFEPRWKEILSLLHSKGLRPFRVDYESETPLDVNDLRQWKHLKKRHVQYYDVVWRMSDYNSIVKA